MMTKSPDTDQELIDDIENIRRSNNGLWMKILRIALLADPRPTRIVLREINENDREIAELLTELANED